MSFEAMAWAATACCGSSLNKLVLLMLANYADENHTAYPSYKKLSELCLCNERTVMRGIKSLEQMKLVEISPRFTKGKGQTSNNFILNVGGDKSYTGGVTKTTPNTIRKKQATIKKRGGDKSDHNTSPDFSKWWAAYPRKDGSKKRAFQLWKKCTEKIKKDELLHITIRFSNAVRGSNFIPMATTWLNEERWETVGAMKTTTTRRNKNQLAG